MNKFYKRFLAAAIMLPALFVAYQTSAQEFDRHIEKTTFVPKGQYFAGATFTYDEYTANDYEFLAVNDLNGSKSSIRGTAYVGYFFKENMAAGLKFAYRRSRLSADKFNFNLSDDFDIDVHSFYTKTQMFYGTAFLRNYIGLGKSRRFGLFNEVDLTLGGGQGKTRNGDGDELEGSYQDIYEAQLGMSPGLVVFVDNHIAIEASANVIGFDYTHYKQTKNQVYHNSLNHTSANLKIDLFSINLGVSFYLTPNCFKRNKK
jgi:hypothetical protein